MGRLVHLPGTRLTPEVTLRRTLDKVDRIKAVVTVIQWDDDTFDVDWSEQRTSNLAMASAVLAGNVQDAIFRPARPGG